ncbi:hypothetical protein ACX27O_26730 [Micromonospora sp. SD19]
MIYCAACNRRMQGRYNHDAAYYRCRFPPGTRPRRRRLPSPQRLPPRGDPHRSTRHLARYREAQTVHAETDLSAHRGPMGRVRGATRTTAPPPLKLGPTLKLTQT